VQTPSNPDGSFSLECVLAACRDVGAALAQAREYKTVAVASTVMPGHTNGPIRECLERASGKVAHEDFGLCYCPEFIRNGSLIRDFSRPNLVVIGHETGAECVALWDYYRAIIDWTTMGRDPVHEITIESAEVAKIGLNVSITSKVARANELATLCHYTPGADATQVLHAIGADPRIGPAYFAVGPPPGCPCFPRDDRAMAAALRERGLHAHVAEGVRKFWQYQITEIGRILCGQVPQGGAVGILGLTYKPGVTMLAGSPGLDLAKWICGWRPDLRILAYDPAIPTGDSIECAPALARLVEDSDALALMTCWPEFKALEGMDMAGKFLLDMWGFLDEKGLKDCRYVRFGEGK